MATHSNNSHAHLPVFEGKNFDQWMVKMKVIFRFQDVLEVVNEGLTALAANATNVQRTTHKELKMKDGKAMFLMHQSVSNEIFEKIMHYESAKETWDALEKLYVGDGKLKKVRLQALRRQYEVFTMEEEEYVSQYFDKVINFTNQMTRNGETVTDVMKVEKVLRTLISRFDHIVVALEESKDLDSMKIEELQASLEAHELRLIDRNRERGKSVSSDQTLQAQYGKGKFKKGKKPWIDYSNKDGEGSSKNQENKKEDAKHDQKKKKKDKKNIQCYNCQKWGHYASECRSKRVPRSKDEAQFSQNEDSEEVLLMATIKEEEERNDE